MKKEHLDILQRGVEIWNRWRNEHREVHPDLRGADFANADLSYARFSFASLENTRFHNARLRHAYFVNASLAQADFSDALLDEAHFDTADLIEANFRRARLYGSKLRLARLQRADLTGADLTLTDLDRANCSDAHFERTDLSFAKIGWTQLMNVNLNTAKGLDTVIHTGPSHLGLRTLARSLSSIPASFLAGSGTPESFLNYARILADFPIEYATCLLSYANPDREFAEHLQTDLQARGVLCHASAYDQTGETVDELRQNISKPILIYDRILFAISRHTVTGTANTILNYLVKEMAGKEQREATSNCSVLYLDKTLDESTDLWAKMIKRMQLRQKVDVMRWNEEQVYQGALTRILDDLVVERHE